MFTPTSMRHVLSAGSEPDIKDRTDRKPVPGPCFGQKLRTFTMRHVCSPLSMLHPIVKVGAQIVALLLCVS